MGRKLAERIRSEDDFKKLLNTLSMDLCRVSDYLTLFNDLLNAKQGEYTSAFVQSQTFWSTVLGSLQTAALHGLARAYDQKDDPLALRTLLETVKSSPTYLPKSLDLDPSQLDKDLSFVSRESNTAVHHLMMWRHKFFAHRDADKIVNSRTLADEFPLTWAEIDSLLENGFTILNRYNRVFFHTVTSRHVHVHNDYHRVLEVLRADEDAKRERFNEELRKASVSPESGTSGTAGT